MGKLRHLRMKAKGQIVIPAKICKRFGIRPGTRIAFVEEQGRILIQPLTNAFIESMRGSLLDLGMPSKLQRDPDRESG